MISVLYIDDDVSLLELSKLYLEDSGEFHIDIVDSASRALDILQGRNYDAIVSDYQMPGMNGIEFLKILRKRNPLIPVIISSGKDREEIETTALETGADFYHQKCVDPDNQFTELSCKIRKSVEQYKTKLALRQAGIGFDHHFQTDSDNIGILDGNGRVLRDSPSAADSPGFPESYITGKRAMDFIHPDDRETAITAFEHVRNGTSTGIPTEFRVRKADGRYMDVELVAMNRIGIDGAEGIVVKMWPDPEKMSQK
jgi:PAS domain S-box-containing protein